MANKFILIPEDVYKGLSSSSNPAAATGNLNLDFARSLVDKAKKERTTNPETKNARYNQALRRYLHLLREHVNKPLKVTNADSNMLNVQPRLNSLPVANAAATAAVDGFLPPPPPPPPSGGDDQFFLDENFSDMDDLLFSPPLPSPVPPPPPPPPAPRLRPPASHRRQRTSGRNDLEQRRGLKRTAAAFANGGNIGEDEPVPRKRRALEIEAVTEEPPTRAIGGTSINLQERRRQMILHNHRRRRLNVLREQRNRARSSIPTLSLPHATAATEAIDDEEWLSLPPPPSSFEAIESPHRRHQLPAPPKRLALMAAPSQPAYELEPTSSTSIPIIEEPSTDDDDNGDGDDDEHGGTAAGRQRPATKKLRKKMAKKTISKKLLGTKESKNRRVRKPTVRPSKSHQSSSSAAAKAAAATAAALNQAERIAARQRLSQSQQQNNQLQRAANAIINRRQRTLGRPITPPPEKKFKPLNLALAFFFI